MERHTVSKLIGAPPGYVGYGEGGKLTEAVSPAWVAPLGGRQGAAAGFGAGLGEWAGRRQQRRGVNAACGPQV
jgi:hypothetical protein